MTDTPDEAGFWGFALKIYAKPGVEKTCLDLQNRSGHQVSMVLAALWLTSLSRSISIEAGARLRLKSAHFQELVTGPLRAVREKFWEAASIFNLTKVDHSPAMNVRSQIKAVELACERLEIDQLGPLLIEESQEATSSNLLGWSNMEALSPWQDDDLDALRLLLSSLVTKSS